MEYYDHLVILLNSVLMLIALGSKRKAAEYQDTSKLAGYIYLNSLMSFLSDLFIFDIEFSITQICCIVAVLLINVFQIYR